MYTFPQYAKRIQSSERYDQLTFEYIDAFPGRYAAVLVKFTVQHGVYASS